MSETMRALLVDRFGSWRAVREAEVPVPVPGPGEILVRTEAAALNFPDLLMIEGRYQVKPPLPFVPGRDVVGRVVAAGPQTHLFAVGDRVCAQQGWGAFADFALLPERLCLPVPSTVSARDIAAVATGIVTVVAAMRLKANLRPGETVLVTGAAGGIGTAALQYARLLGARPLALVSSAQKEAVARRLGAEWVLRSDRIEALRNGLREAVDAAGIGPVHALVDMVGGDVFDAGLRCLAPLGRAVVVGFTSGRIPQVPANYLLVKELAVVGSPLSRLLRERDGAFLHAVEEAFEALGEGRFVAEVDRVLPLAQFGEGAARVAGREVVGKIVFTPDWTVPVSRSAPSQADPGAAPHM